MRIIYSFVFMALLSFFNGAQASDSQWIGGYVEYIGGCPALDDVSHFIDAPKKGLLFGRKPDKWTDNDIETLSLILRNCKSVLETKNNPSLIGRADQNIHAIEREVAGRVAEARIEAESRPIVAAAPRCIPVAGLPPDARPDLSVACETPSSHTIGDKIKASLGACRGGELAQARTRDLVYSIVGTWRLSKSDLYEIYRTDYECYQNMESGETKEDFGKTSAAADIYYNFVKDIRDRIASAASDEMRRSAYEKQLQKEEADYRALKAQGYAESSVVKIQMNGREMIGQKVVIDAFIFTFDNDHAVAYSHADDTNGVDLDISTGSPNVREFALSRCSSAVKSCHLKFKATVIAAGRGAALKLD